MQINSNYSVNGVPYDNKRKQNNIPQFSTECAVQENENINPYMAEADFDEKATDLRCDMYKEDNGYVNECKHNHGCLYKLPEQLQDWYGK